MKPLTEKKILKTIAKLFKSMEEKMDKKFENFELGMFDLVGRTAQEQDEKIETIKKQNDAILSLLDAPAKEKKDADTERAANTSAHERFETRITALEKNLAA